MSWISSTTSFGLVSRLIAPTELHFLSLRLFSLLLFGFFKIGPKEVLRSGLGGFDTVSSLKLPEHRNALPAPFLTATFWEMH